MQRFFYRNLRAISSFKYWVGGRFTQPGLFVLAGLAASAVLGLDTRQTMAYQMFTFLLALLLVAVLSSLFFQSRFTAIRSAPRYVTAGQSFVCRVELCNQTGKMQKGLILWENLTDPRPSFAEFVGTASAVELKQSYRRWRQTIALNQNAVTKVLDLPFLLPASSTEVSTEITPLHRGYLRFTGVTVARPDPFGLFRACVTIPAVQSVLVLPKCYALPNIPLPGARKYRHGWLALASEVGDYEEFIGLRDYRPGDPLQHIHWKSLARAGKPVVKEFQDEFFERYALVLDTFLQSGNGEIFEEAVSVAASFMCANNTQECLLDLMFVEAEPYCFSAGLGQLHTENMLKILAGVQSNEYCSFDELRHSVALRRHTLSGCICILLSWDEARQEFIRQLRVQGLPVLVLVISDAPIEGATATWLRVLQVGNIQQGLAKL